VKAIYWRQTSPAIICAVLSALSFLALLYSLISLRNNPYYDVVNALTALSLFVFINLYRYYNRERAMIFDDENQVLRVDYGSSVLMTSASGPIHRPVPIDLSDVFQSLSFKSGVREMKYSDIRAVSLFDDRDMGLTLEIQYPGPWDTTLRLKIHEKEAGKDAIKEMAEELKKRSKGENYEFVFTDNTGEVNKAAFSADMKELSDSEPYEIR
jgi:hypothetical protein